MSKVPSYTMPQWGVTKAYFMVGDEGRAFARRLNAAFPVHGMCRSGAAYLGHKGYVEVQFIEESDKDIFLKIINNWSY